MSPSRTSTSSGAAGIVLAAPPPRSASKLRIHRDLADHVATFTLSGRIDESTSLQEIADAPARRAILDLGDVQSISSYGIRLWIRMLDELSERRLEVGLRRVPPSLSSQMNLIADTRAPVESFLATLECARCTHVAPIDVIIEISQHAELIASRQLPEVPCRDCRRPLVLDEDVRRFLRFLDLPPERAALRRGAPPAAGTCPDGASRNLGGKP